MKLQLHFLLLIIGFVNVASLTAQDTLNVDSQHCFIDDELKMILINQDLETLAVSNTVSYIAAQEVWKLDTVQTGLSLGEVYTVTTTDSLSYELYFTQLPIVALDADSTVVNEPKVLADMSMVESTGAQFQSAIGIELRGGWTRGLEKKSYRIEFWDDSLGQNKVDYSLLGMREDDDWNLQAMCNEPLLIRSKTGYALWESIDTLAYQTKEPLAINGVRQVYVELFFNNNYHGIYALSEIIDRKQLQLAKSTPDSIHGELYKGNSWGATTFGSAPNFDNNQDNWGGFEFQYPKDTLDWSQLYEFVDFVVYAEDSVFYEQYAERFDVNNAVNYFIFLNLLRAADNTGKNIYIAKYDQDRPYFYVPWDMDGTLGLKWDGTSATFTRGILWNGFYKRLIEDSSPGGFAEQLTLRWQTLRQSVITKENIISILEDNYHQLESNGAYLREAKLWEKCGSLDRSELEYISDWLDSRIEYLDRVFNNTWMISSTVELDQYDERFTIFPNPVSYSFIVQTDKSVAHLEIYNAIGGLVYSALYQEENKIDVSHLEPGSYLVVLYFREGQRSVQRLQLLR